MQNMAKYLSTAFFRDVVNRHRYAEENERITFDRMLELIEQEVIRNYNGKENNQRREVAQGK
jgi:hypothetical protein